MNIELMGAEAVTVAALTQAGKVFPFLRSLGAKEAIDGTALEPEAAAVASSDLSNLDFYEVIKNAAPPKQSIDHILDNFVVTTLPNTGSDFLQGSKILEAQVSRVEDPTTGERVGDLFQVKNSIDDHTPVVQAVSFVRSPEAGEHAGQTIAQASAVDGSKIVRITDNIPFPSPTIAKWSESTFKQGTAGWGKNAEPYFTTTRTAGGLRQVVHGSKWNNYISEVRPDGTKVDILNNRRAQITDPSGATTSLYRGSDPISENTVARSLKDDGSSLNKTRNLFGGAVEVTPSHSMSDPDRMNFLNGAKYARFWTKDEPPIEVYDRMPSSPGSFRTVSQGDVTATKLGIDDEGFDFKIRDASGRDTYYRPTYAGGQTVVKVGDQEFKTNISREDYNKAAALLTHTQSGTSIQDLLDSTV